MPILSRAPTFDLNLMTPEPPPKSGSLLFAGFEVLFGTPMFSFFGYFGPQFTEIALKHQHDPHAVAGLLVGIVMTGISILGLAIATHGAITLWKGREP